MISFKPASGFRDFFNDSAVQRLQLIQTIQKVYQSHGFLPLQTPALESLDLLTGKGGGVENEKLIFKVLKRGQAFEQSLKTDRLTEASVTDLGLRFDLTLPLARVAAGYEAELTLPWKVFQLGSVWRAERAQKGRLREFLQCDVDLIGAQSLGAELEVLQAGLGVFQQLGLLDFQLHLNDRRLLEALADRWEVPKHHFQAFAILLDKLDKVELRDSALEAIERLLEKSLPNELLDSLSGKLSLDQVEGWGLTEAKDLSSLLLFLKQASLPVKTLVFDPTLVRGMGYYSGVVFELRHADAGYAFGGGGRYDGLIDRLRQPNRSHTSLTPACGFSIGFERLFLYLQEKAAQKLWTRAASFFVPVWEANQVPFLLPWAGSLRGLGFLLDLYPEWSHRLKKQFQFAAESGYRWVLILGAREWEQQIVQIKDLAQGKQVSVPLSQVASYLTQLLG